MMQPHLFLIKPSSNYALIRIGAAMLALASLLLHQTSLSLNNVSDVFVIAYLIFALSTFSLSLLPIKSNRALNLTSIAIDILFLNAAISLQTALLFVVASPLFMLGAAWILPRFDHKLIVLFHLTSVVITTAISDWQLFQPIQFMALSYLIAGALYSWYQAKLLDSLKPSRLDPTRAPKIDIATTHEIKSNNSHQKFSVLLNDTSENNPLLVQLNNWGGKLITSDDTIEALANTMAITDREKSPTTFIADFRNRDEDPELFVKLIHSSKKTQNVRCILIADKQSQQEKQSQWNKHQFEAGYDAVLTTPLDNTLLFNALHSNEKNIEAKGVTSLFDHYVQSKSSLPPLEILLAENNPTQLKIIKRQLESFGHNVYSTRSGEQALDAMITHRFDIAMLSLQLNEIDGIEASRIYHLTHPRSLAAPIVILTNNNNSDIQHHCDQAGVNAIIDTPVTSIELQTVITEVIESNTNKLKDEQFRWDSAINSTSTHKRPQLLDVNTLRELEQLGNGLIFVQDLIDNFIKDSNDLIKEMQYVIKNEDFETFQDCAHAIKGSAGSVGASQLQHIAKNIANCSIQDFKDSAHIQVNLLNESLKLTHGALLTHVNERNEHTSNH